MSQQQRNNQVDELDEDPIIPSQQFVVLSYAFSEQKDRNGNNIPLLKIRGSYRTLEECDKRIKTLDNVSKDPQGIALMKAEVGKWLGLYSYEELQKNSDVDLEYKSEFLNEAMKGLRDSERLSNEKFFDRVKTEVEQIKSDSTQEGQLKLSEEREHPISVFNRFKTFEHSYQVLQEKMKEVQEKMESAKEKLKDYSQEEIEVARAKIAEAFGMSQGNNQIAGPSSSN
jgi:hypothetical protein